MTYFLIAGEASGDLHGSHLIESIRKRDGEARFVGLGGDKMQEAGCRLYQHYSEMAYMGFVAVLANIDKVWRNFRIAKKALRDEKPDVLVLIDYPSFNLKMAAYSRKHLPETKICYYIPPKIWAWKSWRIKKIAALCDEVQCIFPFEPEYYRTHSSVFAAHPERSIYVGNPTAEEVGAYMEQHADVERVKDSIVILPGSRKSEVKHCIEKMLEATRLATRFSGEKGLRIVVTGAPGIDDDYYKPYLRPGETLTRDTYEAVLSAKVAVVNSGTATLETALLGTPQVAVYHLSMSGLIALLRPMFQQVLFSIPYFTLVNIIAGREVIRECVANDFTVQNVEHEIQRLLQDEAYRNRMQEGYAHVKSLLNAK